MILLIFPDNLVFFLTNLDSSGCDFPTGRVYRLVLMEKRKSKHLIKLNFSPAKTPFGSFNANIETYGTEVRRHTKVTIVLLD